MSSDAGIPACSGTLPRCFLTEPLESFLMAKVNSESARACGHGTQTIPFCSTAAFSYLKATSLFSLCLLLRLSNRSWSKLSAQGMIHTDIFECLASLQRPTSLGGYAEKPKSCSSKSPLVLKDCFTWLVFTHPRMAFAAFTAHCSILQPASSPGPGRKTSTQPGIVYLCN